MLSLHKFATRVLVKASHDRIDLKSEERDALLARQFVVLDRVPPGCASPRLTPDGDRLLRIAARR